MNKWISQYSWIFKTHEKVFYLKVSTFYLNNEIFLGFKFNSGLMDSALISSRFTQRKRKISRIYQHDEFRENLFLKKNILGSFIQRQKWASQYLWIDDFKTISYLTFQFSISFSCYPWRCYCISNEYYLERSKKFPTFLWTHRTKSLPSRQNPTISSAFFTSLF